MINKIINIDVDFDAMGVEKSPRQTTLTTYILDNRNIEESSVHKRPAVVICPGGGYSFTSAREAEPIAMKYCSAGYHCFVLDYAIAPAAWPAAVSELSKAVAYVKSIADDNNIDKEQVFVCGFSAGGHLAASLGVYWNHPTVRKFSGVKGDENKPKGIILGYPVITGEAGRTNQGTIDNFIGGRSEVEPLAWLERGVSKDTPPAFIWHTATDDNVPVVSSLRFASALDENGVNFELHIYPEGRHGLSLSDWNTCTEGTYVEPPQGWIDMSIRWIKEL